MFLALKILFMEKLKERLPGYKVYEYLLVLTPHEELCNKVMAVKKDFYKKYKTVDSAQKKPYITLISFLQYEMLEDRISNRLNMVAMAFHPIKVEMKDFGSFPSHTIYINITSKLPIQALVKTIRTETQRLMKFNEDNKPHFILEPYLTIARRLLPWQYEQGWLEYSHKHFTGRFIAGGMLLLKRIQGEMKYEIAKRFEFKNLPVGTKQGDLFM